MKAEFIPNDKAIWQSDTAKTYQCPYCLRPIFTQYEGDVAVTEDDIECLPDGHRVRWTGEA